MAVWVEFVSVCDIPSPAGASVVVGHGLFRSVIFRFVRIKCVSIAVFCAAYRAGASPGVDLEDGVLGTVDVRVHAQTEKMLMVVCVDPGVHLGAPSLGVFARV